MLTMKAFSVEDADKVYEFFCEQPREENGVYNYYYGLTKKQFDTYGVRHLIDNANGNNLPEGYVPETYFFLWLDDTIIGLYKIRHYLNDALREGAGHIGCFIKKEYRGQGYGTQGLSLAIINASQIIKEDEIYMACYKWNVASLKTQLKCGAYIHHESETEYYTRIKRLKL